MGRRMKHLKDEHISYLKKELGLSPEEFIRICKEYDSKEFEDLFDTIVNKDFDLLLEHLDSDVQTDEEKCIGWLIALMSIHYDGQES